MRLNQICKSMTGLILQKLFNFFIISGYYDYRQLSGLIKVERKSIVLLKMVLRITEKLLVVKVVDKL